ncbi:MAG: beta-ketoacyl synthase N-terminal-like domain-containing protein [Planctomycetota bacterium]|nr:beta-ketoacyl synthase N-terminal-like domain-containing protein [Planctomycetota bacterium]
MQRRVVVSGCGAVTGFGYGVQPLWEGLYAGRSVLRRVRAFDPTGHPCQASGEAADFSAKDHVPKHYRKAVKVMARDIELAVGAAKAAVEDAGVRTRGNSEEGQATTYEPRRIGCQIGAGLIAAEIPELTLALAASQDERGAFSYEKFGRGGMDNLNPLWLLKYLPNMLACHVTIIHEACGPSNTITCGEASGVLSIGESMRVIERGDADLCFAGGAESKVNPMGFLRMHLAGRTAPIEAAEGDEEVWRHVRPFDPQGRGTVLGEGGGILLLEAFDTAAARGAKMSCELLGFGAGHSPMLGGPGEKAEGLQAAIENALADAGMDPDAIDAIVPRGLGARACDEEEAEALRRVFGGRLGRIPLVTTAPNIGDATAGGGGIAACVGAMCIRHQMLPARLHAGAPAAGLEAGAAAARDARLRRVLVCTGSLGGQNGALVMGRVDG